MTRRPSRVAQVSRSLAAVTLGSLMIVGLPSSGTASDGDEVRRQGSCSAAADWEMRVRWDDDHRIEVRGRVDGNGGAQGWRWRIKHNGSISAQGHASASGGSFEVRRSLVDLPGLDHCVFRAVRVRTGEVCRGAVDW